MSVRLPLTTVLDVQDNGNLGAASTAGGIAHQFYIPQDTDEVVVKLTASVAGGGVSAIFQTTDDGGTTWYDVARTSVLSRANGTTADWLSAPVISSGTRSKVTFGGSILTATIGSAAASSLGTREVSGMPILSQLGRVFLIYTAAVDTNTLARVQVKVNSQNTNT